MFVIQIANMGMFIVEGFAPEYAIYVAAVVGAMQAFVGRIQGASN